MKTTKDWLEFHLKESERFQNLILNQTLNDASALGGALSRLVLHGKTERPSGVVLSGPSGSGKHHAANHILQALDQEDCAPVFLTGASLAEGVSGFFELAERINALLDEFYDREQGVCIVLEEPDACGFSGQLYPFLGRIAHEYKNNPDELPALFLILIANEPPALPSVLADLLLCCTCTLPDLNMRRAFIDARARSLRTYVDLESLASETEGCSYAAIGRVVRGLEFLVDTSDRAPDSETISALIRQAAPETVRDTPVRQAEADPVAAALERLETVFTGISDKLSKLRFGELISPKKEKERDLLFDEPEDVNTDPRKSRDLSLDRAQVEQMSVRELSVDLFGEERVHVLLEN